MMEQQEEYGEGGGRGSGGSGGETDIFEITDFTNATLWESFIADLESLFRQWELARPDHEQSSVGGMQHRKTERISYSSRQFVVTLEVNGGGGGGGGGQRDGGLKKNSVAEWPGALNEILDSSGDFPPRAHHLARWYGLTQFVVVCPTEGAESLHSQAQANLMLSSVSIAISNTGCTTPVFVQLHQPWRLVYVGVCETERLRVDFSVTHLRHAPPQFNHLSGLLNIFKSKIGAVAMNPTTTTSNSSQPVGVSIRFLYVLRHWSLDDWPVEPLGDVDKGFDAEYLDKLRVGAFADPVKELHLSAIWPKLTEELITDTGTYSDLNPCHASVWTVSLHLTENANCILAETLLNFYQLCFRNGSVAEMLGKASLWDEDASGPVSESYSKPLDRLTSPGSTLASPLFQSVVYTATQRMESGHTSEENITERDLEAVVKFLFPDAYQSDNHTHSSSSSSSSSSQGEREMVVKLKSAPLDSLTSRLAKALAIVNTECGVKAMCKVWHEVTLELRHRWENGILLPLMSEGPPDMKCCLLHQKLQMLNCSILHKVKHQLYQEQQQQQHRHLTRRPHPQTPPTSNEISTSSSSSPLSSTVPMVHNYHSTASPNTPNSTTQEEEEGNKRREGVRRNKQEVVRCEDVTMTTDKVSENESDDEFFEALETHEDEEEKEEEDKIENNQSLKTKSTREDNRTLQRDEKEGAGEKEERSKEAEDSGGGDENERKERSGSRSREQRPIGGDSRNAEQKNSPAADVEGGRGGGGGGGEAGRGSIDEDNEIGRQKLCGDLVLIATGEPMYIPVTQEHPPLTEDHVWEQQAVMAQLGTSEEATRLRAKMQSSSLMSDMQAFKAANPRCVLEDFVRWYSPRDWVDGELGEEEEEEEVVVGKEMEAEEGISGDGEAPEEMEVDDGRREEGGEWKHKDQEEGELKGGRREKTDRNLSEMEIESAGGEKDRPELEEKEGWDEGEEWEVLEGDTDSNNEQRDKETTTQSQNDQSKTNKKYVSGRLSVRMRQPGGLWREVWSVAEPIPTHRQKKLFDDTREAEKVLHYLASLKTAELALLILPILTHSAVHALREKHAAHPLSSSESHLTDAISLLSSIPHPTIDSLPKYREVVSLLSQTEHLQAAGNSLRMKLQQGLDLSGSDSGEEKRSKKKTGRREKEEEEESEIGAGVEVLLQEAELVLQDPTSSRIGQALQGLLAAQVATRDLEEQEVSGRKIRVSQDSFPLPSGREFILRTSISSPTPHSLPTPQRMYCVLTPTEFRLAGAFSTDTLVT